MKPKTRLGTGIGAGLIFLVLVAAAPAFAHAVARSRHLSEIARGRMLTFTCIGCHGLRGIDVTYPFYNVPKVAGQNRQYLYHALMDYRRNLREFPTMRAQAHSMTIHDLSDIATYFASLRGQVTTRTPLYSRSEAQAGAKLITTCAACHGLHGIAVAPEFPDLAGQYPSYLVRALEEYQSGQRKNAIMNSMAAHLSHRDMVDIANYFASQKGPLGQLPKR